MQSRMTEKATGAQRHVAVPLPALFTAPHRPFPEPFRLIPKVVNGPVRVRYDIGDGRIAEVDTILSTLEEWPTRPESSDPCWITWTTADGIHVQAQRLCV